MSSAESTQGVPSAREADRTAFVTGAASGIGLEVARELAREGFRIVAADLAFGDDQRDDPEFALSLKVDVTSTASIRDAAGEVARHVGAVDVVVNSAGVVIPGTVDSLADEDWDLQIATNLKGVFVVAREFRALLAQAPNPSVVTIASTAGLVASKERAAYSASKAGVIMLTKCMALDWAEERIRVNCICPGWIDTPMVRNLLEDSGDLEGALREAGGLHPRGRIGYPGDIAPAVAFLASDRADWITGSCLVVDGGLTAGA